MSYEKNAILFSDASYECNNISIWNRPSTINVWSALQIRMAWCWSTRDQYLKCWLVAHASLLWHHNGSDVVPNHQPHHCLLNCKFRRRSEKTSKLPVTGLCAGNSPYSQWQSLAPFIGNSTNRWCQKQHYNLQLCLQILCKYVLLR